MWGESVKNGANRLKHAQSVSKQANTHLPRISLSILWPSSHLKNGPVLHMDSLNENFEMTDFTLTDSPRKEIREK